ncbi:MAG: hypothetical protein R3E39_24360 [Anaerolineae bacterium]
MVTRYAALLGGIMVFIMLVGCSPSSQSPTAKPTVEQSASATNTLAAQAEAATPTQETLGGAVSSQSVAATCSKLNLNTLTSDELMSTIPNFSSRMVREFQEYRPYASIQQFRREIGKYVDAAQVTEYEQYVYVPVSPNDSDADTLQQLPGVDATTAATLMSSRPYESNQTFLEALAKLVTPDQLASASCFLGAST